MFWIVRGATATLALRCCGLSGRFEECREARCARAPLPCRAPLLVPGAAALAGGMAHLGLAEVRLLPAVIRHLAGPQRSAAILRRGGEPEAGQKHGCDKESSKAHHWHHRPGTHADQPTAEYHGQAKQPHGQVREDSPGVAQPRSRGGPRTRPDGERQAETAGLHPDCSGPSLTPSSRAELAALSTHPAYAKPRSISSKYMGLRTWRFRNQPAACSRPGSRKGRVALGFLV